MTQTHEEIALVTGASSGLGQATAAGLSRRGYTVVMVARSRERAEPARQAIMTASGSPRVDLLLADLASQAAIRRLAAEFHERYNRLDLLVNNAGNSFSTRQLSPDGIEMSLAVNHLAAFLLTHLLLDTLRHSAPARIVNVGTRLNTAIDFNDVQWARRPYRALSAYAQSKLGNLHFTFELAARLAASGVTVNCVHPGVFRSNLGHSGGPVPGWLRLITHLGRPFLASAEKAAERVLWVATDPSLETVTGRYFGDRVELPAPAQPLDPMARARFWSISEQLVEQHPHSGGDR